MADEKYMIKVQALLNTAGHPATAPEEAEAAIAKATELMAKYSIDQAMLDSIRPKQDVPIDKKYQIPSPYGVNKTSLMNVIAKALGCKLVRIQTGKVQVVHVFGYQTDIEHMELLYTSLLLQMTGQGLRMQGYDAGHTRSLRNTWMMGFVNAVGKRLEEAYSKARKDAEEEYAGTSTALVLADRKSIIDQMVSDTCGKLRPGGRRYYRDRQAYASGQQAGRRADIGQGRVGRTAKALR